MGSLDKSLAQLHIVNGAPSQANGVQRQPSAGEYQVPEFCLGTRRSMKAICIGFGMSGIDLAYKARNFPGLELQIYEKNSEAGGTWLENHYPGVACDVAIATYQLSWALKTDWKDYYAKGGDICKYLQKIAKDNDLYRFVKFNHQIVSADFLEESGKWRLTIMQDGDPAKVVFDEADVLINASGILNNWKWPSIPGLHNFQGALTHSANWDTSLDLQGKRAAVIGVGSSGIQVVAAIAKQVKQLYVFNRSKTWVLPGFVSKYIPTEGEKLQYPEALLKRFQADPDDYLEYVKCVELELAERYKGLMRGSPQLAETNKMATLAMHHELQNRQDLIDALVPTNFAFGCRRPTPGIGFLPALVQPNTSLITGPISSVDATGIITHTGEHIDVDAILCCTGFDTTFKPRFPLNVRGKNMQDAIGAVNQTSYLGLASAGVPNYFVSLGAYAAYIQGSASKTIETSNLYFLQMIQKMQSDLIKEITPKAEVTKEFTEHADLFLQKGVWTDPCPSWYKNGDPYGKPAIWPGSRAHSIRALEVPRFEDYDIKYLYPNRFALLGNGFDVADFGEGDPTWYYERANGATGAPVWRVENE